MLLYFLLPKIFKWPVLLVSSYIFYAYYSPSLALLIFGTTLVSWVCAMLLERTEKRWVRRSLLALTLTVCLGVLFFYKYFDFLSESIASLPSSCSSFFVLFTSSLNVASSFAVSLFSQPY